MRLNVNYYLPKYQNSIEKLRNANRGRLHKISDFADVVCGPFGSAIKNGDYLSEGIPLLRITNISPDGVLDYGDLKFISEKLSEKLHNNQVSCGDIVISQRGSLGLCAIVDDRYRTLNISANLIAIKNIKGHSPEFIRNFLNSSICKDFLAKAQSGQIQSKINTSDISEIPIPFGLDEVSLNLFISKEYEKYISKKQQADELLASVNEFIDEKLGCCKLSTSPQMCVGICFEHLNTARLDANFYRSRHSVSHKSSFEMCNLGEIAFINDNSKKIASQDNMVPYVGLPDCSKSEIEQVVVKRYSDVSGRNIAFPNDILFARIEPSIFNKKYVWAGDLLGHDYAFLSTEFYTIRSKNPLLQRFIYAMLFYQPVYQQFFGMTTGSTGRRRLDKNSLSQISIPVPGVDICVEIGNEFFARRKKAKTQKQEAEKEWQNAREQFEKELLGE